MLLQIRRQAANEQLEAVAQFKELNYKVQVQELIEQYDTDRQALVSMMQLDLSRTQAGRHKLIKQLVAATTHSTCMSHDERIIEELTPLSVHPRLTVLR